MVCLVWMSGKGRRGTWGTIFNQKERLHHYYIEVSRRQFFVFHRRGSINHAWFSPGLMSVLHMCERTSLVEGFLGIEAVSGMWGTLGDMGYSFPKKRTSEI